MALVFRKKKAPAAPDPFVLAFPAVKRAWGAAWGSLARPEQIRLVGLKASGKPGWEPPVTSLTGDDDFGDDDDVIVDAGKGSLAVDGGGFGSDSD